MFSFADQFFEFFFAPGYPITWGAASSDSRFPVRALVGAAHSTRFAVAASLYISHSTRFPVYALVDIGHDTAFAVQAVSRSRSTYSIVSNEAIGHDTRFVIEAGGVEIGHATLFTIRIEDSFTN